MVAKGFLIFDGNGLAWRMAIGRQGTGFASGVLLRTTEELLNWKTKFPGWRVVLVFDGGKSNLRETLYPAYKANRLVTEDRKFVFESIGYMQSALDRLGKPYVRVQGVEADDLISILATLCRQHTIPAIIVSDDSDLFQCLGGGVQQYVPRLQELHTATTALAEWYGDPELYIAWKAMAGDSSDNIPGVRGIGGKRAHELIGFVKHRGVEWLFGEQAAGLLGSKKWAAVLNTPEGRAQFDLARRLIRTARTFTELSEIQGDPLHSAAYTEVRRYLGKLKSPSLILEFEWLAICREFDVLPLIGDTLRLQELYGFSIVS